MCFATRHRDDPSPILEPLTGLELAREYDAARMAALQSKAEREMGARMTQGHRAYLALLDGVPAGWGWVATRHARIGEVGADFTIPSGQRYLWNFVTLPRFRGRGVYPRLLRAIVQAEAQEAERFWVGYAPENHASGVGINKAGFTTVADLAFDPEGRPRLRDRVSGGAARAAALLRIPVTDGPVGPCWRCARASVGGGTACANGVCDCDYQRNEAGCGRTDTHAHPSA